MVANAIASALPALLSAGMAFSGGATSADSSLQSYKYSRALQQHQYELNRQTRQTAYQDTRYSLEQAGYNPILAVGQQANGGAFGATLNAQDPKTERLNNVLNSLSNYSQLRLNSANAYNQIMQGRLTNAQAYNLISQSRLNSAQTGLVNLQQNAQAIQNLHLPSYLKSQILYNNNTAQANMMNAQSNQINANANMMNARTNSAVGASTAWRNYNQSLGYTTSYHIGPSGVSYSHTGNSNIQPPGSTQKKGYYRTEYINGKPVQVYVIR